MKAVRLSLVTALLAAAPAFAVYASQGPGTTGGAATATDKAVFFGAIVVALFAGLFFKLRHR
jgi:hypothetical protein